jgi:hypothetical protein
VRIAVDTTIEQPRDVVFAAFCDLAGAVEHMRGVERIELITPGPFDIGTRWRETRRVLGRATTEELWVTRIERGRMYRVEGESSGTHYTSDLLFEDDGREGTRVTMVFQGQPVTRAARLLAIAAPLAAASTRRVLIRDLDDMREALEHSRM